MKNKVLKWFIRIAFSVLVVSILILIFPKYFNKVNKERFDFDTYRVLSSEKIEIKPASERWIREKVDRNCLSPDPNDCLIWCKVEEPAEFKIITNKELIGKNTCLFQVPNYISKGERFECQLIMNNRDTSDSIHKKLLSDSLTISANLEDNLTDLSVKANSQINQVYNGQNKWNWLVKGDKSGELLLKIESGKREYEFQLIEKIPIVIRDSFGDKIMSGFKSILSFCLFVITTILTIIIERYVTPILPKLKGKNVDDKAQNHK